MKLQKTNDAELLHIYVYCSEKFLEANWQVTHCTHLSSGDYMHCDAPALPSQLQLCPALMSQNTSHLYRSLDRPKIFHSLNASMHWCIAEMQI